MKKVKKVREQQGQPASSRLSAAVTKSAASCVALTVSAALSSQAMAAGKIEISDESWVSVGAGIRSVAMFNDEGAPDGGASYDFETQNLRLYINGQISKNIGFTFNTDETFGNGLVNVLDSFVSFSFTPQFNIHLGRHLVPADRIEMNGPFYSLTWNQYTQPLYASDQVDVAGNYGRDDGVTFWGTAGKFQYAVGFFEGLSGAGSANAEDSPLIAARFAYNFLNMEDNPAYYTSSTYYGGLGDILTLALSYQSQANGVGTAQDPGDFSGYTVDMLFEKVLAAKQVLTIEAEFKSFDSDYEGGSPSDFTNFGLFDGESSFISAAYLLGGEGPGRFQPYLRFVENSPTNFESSSLTEVGVNYVIKGHNARLNLNVSSGDANISGYKGQDANTLSFGVQLQI